MSSTSAAAQDMPPEVAHLKRAVENVPGVSSVEITRLYLPDFDLSDLSLPANLRICRRRLYGGQKAAYPMNRCYGSISRSNALRRA